jgi:hypothetical protein
MRGIAELMDGAMQQAPQPSRQFMTKSGLPEAKRDEHPWIVTAQTDV